MLLGIIAISISQMPWYVSRQMRVNDYVMVIPKFRNTYLLRYVFFIDFLIKICIENEKFNTFDFI